MTAATTQEKLIWKPVGENAFEIIGARATWRVEKIAESPNEQFPWKAWSRPAESPPGHILECVWRADRRAGFDWCAANMGYAEGTMHLIGEA